MLNGKKATFGSDFKITRYAVVLLAATLSEIFKDQTKVIRGKPCFTIYKLPKIASHLNLDFDKTRAANKIYQDLATKGAVKKVTTPERKTYFNLTDEGIDACLKRL